MKTITKQIELYEFAELTENAKEKARYNYTYAYDEFILQDIIDAFQADMDYLKIGDFELQYNVGCTQGSGANIYGILYLHEASKILELSDYEKNVILDMIEKNDVYQINLPCNQRYTYSLSDKITIRDLFDYENEEEKNVIERLETLIQDYFSNLCQQWYDIAYRAHNEPDDETITAASEANNFYFLSDGKIYYDRY